MTDQERIWFNELSKEHALDAKTFQKPNYRGMWDRLVDMYKESAHFVYELIQNADDAHATEASFELTQGQLIFKHNGTKRFTISDPYNEEKDRGLGKLGDINSITSIGFSTKADGNKSDPGNSIGKFGIGFKSVFVYTETPQIFDSNISFQIREKIIPELISSSAVSANNCETIFVIPFNNPSKSSEKAFDEIKNQLKGMRNPTLFLNHLEKISYCFKENGTLFNGCYQKIRKQEKYFHDQKSAYAELLTLEHKVNGSIQKETIWLFSRKVQEKLRISVGFYLHEGKLIAKREPAYCFFQTKEETYLDFIVHAPFLLTPDRQHIKDGEIHNKSMLLCLAELSADCFEYLRDLGVDNKSNLIDDDILSIVPTQTSDFYIQTRSYNYSIRQYDVVNVAEKTFSPFYKKILSKFQNAELLPSNGKFVDASHSYWAEDSSLIGLFQNEDLAKITEKDGSRWVFVSKPRTGVDGNHREWLEKVLGCGRVLSEDYFLRKITSSFCEEKFKSNPNWFVSLYEWLDSAKKRTEYAKSMPILIDENGVAKRAFENNLLQIFLPNNDFNEYSIINSCLYKNAVVKNFLFKLGLKEPSLKDEIYTKIFPRYKLNEIDDDVIKSDLKKIIAYYDNLPNGEVDLFLNDVRNNVEFIHYTGGSDEKSFSSYDEIYLKTDLLEHWFADSSSVKFLNIDFYKDSLLDENKLMNFFSKLGVSRCPKFLSNEYNGCGWMDRDKKLAQFNLKWSSFESYNRKVLNYRFDEFKFNVDIVDNILYLLENVDLDKSKMIWNVLKEHLNFYGNTHTITVFFKNSQGYEHRAWYQCCPIRLVLSKYTWLRSKNDEWKFSNDIYIEELSEEYDVASAEAILLIKFLGLRNKPVYVAPQPKFDAETQKKIDLFEKLKNAGLDDLTDEEMNRILYERQKKQNHVEGVSPAINEENNLSTDLKRGDVSNNRVESPKEKIIREITNRTVEKKTEESLHNEPDSNLSDYELDEDEFSRASVNFQKKIEKAKEKCAVEVNALEDYERAHNLAQSANKYSYLWFKSLLKLEQMENSDDGMNSRAISISFGKVEKDNGTQKTLVLKYPNKPIPRAIEDLVDIPLVLHYKDGSTRTLPIEVASILSFNLRVKLKSAESLYGVDLASVTEARIDAKSPVFLLNELQKQFDQLGYDDEFNMKENLCDNIKFIFGPPGTGKTTFLVTDVLNKIISENEKVKILVLAPTNKAADVIVNRVCDIYKEDRGYEKWLIRFGVTNDERIEAGPLFCGKDLKIENRDKSVVVTTIARFPYDYFIDENTKSAYIRDIEWDYIVVDEASMIPLVQMIYPLYFKKPQQFIIAGDPFQIEPPASVDIWKLENIYSMVRLNSFKDPRTEPVQYDVKLLTTQYRSVPSVGKIFSELTYSGLLKHHREESSRRDLGLSELGYESLNIIKFPVSKYESIYRSKNLNRSHYHMYSALFAYEFSCYIAQKISEKIPNDFCKIGVISPYNAQAKLVNSLLLSVKLPENVSISCGTIHGFQGDECDIIVSLFNAPEHISDSKQMFLNHQNIVNVAISRARDYLFVLMPDDDTEKVGNLKLLKNLERLIKLRPKFKEFKSHDLEQLMFGNSNYLEENVFTTGHQTVNVYGKPEKRFEVRSEDDALDVQLHLES